MLKEQRAEYDRIRLECDTLTSQLTRVLEAQAASERRAEAYRLDADSSGREAKAANEQLHDLSRQIRVLTRELALREDPGIAGRSAGEMDEDDVDVTVDINDPEDVMQAHFVTFRSVDELQSKNQQLIKIARGLAQQLNADHEARIEDEAREANEAVAEAHELILQLKDERDTLSVRVEALSRERDMFRQMVGSQQGGHAAVNGAGQEGVVTGGATSAAAARSLAEVQAQFEAYKVEIGADSRRIREELSATRNQLSQAQTALARANATIEYNTGASTSRARLLLC